jgi:hypothetical protein
MRHPVAIVALLAVSSSALTETATDKAQNQCTTVFKDYLASGLALSQRDPMARPRDDAGWGCSLQINSKRVPFPGFEFLRAAPSCIRIAGMAC